MRQIRSVIGATVINPALLTCAERLQYEGFLRREEINAAILALAKDGVAIKQIVKRTGYARQAGRRNAAALWRSLRERGYRGSLRVVSEWATRRRRTDRADAGSLARVPSARTIARLMATSRDNLSKADTVTIAAIEGGVPARVEAREILSDFHQMIRRKNVDALPSWLERAAGSLVASFGSGV